MHNSITILRNTKFMHFINPKSFHHREKYIFSFFFSSFFSAYCIYMKRWMLVEPIMAITCNICKSNHQAVCLKLIQYRASVIFWKILEKTKICKFVHFKGWIFWLVNYIIIKLLIKIIIYIKNSTVVGKTTGGNKWTGISIWRYDPEYNKNIQEMENIQKKLSHGG